MSDSSYCLVFEGKIVEGQDLAEVKKRLQKVFKKDAHTIEKLFSGRKVKLKQGLKKEQADQYLAKMISIGAQCTIESQAAKSSQPATNTVSQTVPASKPAVSAAVASNVAQPTVEKNAKPIKLADIDKAFIGHIPKVDLPNSYKAGVVAMGVTMVLLPLLYVGLVGLLGYGVISHSIVNTSWMQSLGAKFGFIAYITPIVAGVTVILFMIKPLFAPPAVKSKTVLLDSVKEPLLFHFVNKVAVAVGAPRPKQIEVDCEVNASASFRKGLFSFFGDDLVLTIGLPLLAGFNTKQLAGVLAHEFGHFSQGVGMRFHYLAYKINSWLYYSVHARDSWDEKLDQLAERTESWASVILNFARGGVWLTRKVLHVFMMTGQVVSSYMLRQMEFDADRYETQLAGSDQFKDTSLRLQRLAAAYQVSHEYLAQAWEDKKLVNDFPSLVAHNATQLPEQLDQALLAAMEEAKTHIYDSHPSDKERIANAAAQQAKGIVTLNRHSRELFKSFDYLAKQVSNLYYAHELGLDFDSSKLVDISQVVKIAHDNEKQQEAYHKYFKDTAPVFDLPLSVNIFDTSKTNWDDLLIQYQQVNNQLAEQIADRRMLMKKADECYAKHQHFAAIRDLEDANFVLFPEWFDITPEILDASKKQKIMYEQAWQQSIEQLKPLFAVNDNRLSIALTLLNHPKAIEANPEHAHHLKTRNHLSLLVNNIRRNAEMVVDFRNKHARLLAFMSCAQNISGQKQADVASVRNKLLEELKLAAQNLTAALSRLDYPYVAEGEHQTIADYLETMLPRANQFSNESEFYLASGNIILEKLDAIYGRIISGLANVALTVEILIPYIEGKAPMPELATQPVIEQEVYVPAEVTEAEIRAMQMAQAVGAEDLSNRAASSTQKPTQVITEEEKPKEPVKINVREIKNPGTRSVFAIDETENKPLETKEQEVQQQAETAAEGEEVSTPSKLAQSSASVDASESSSMESQSVQAKPAEQKPLEMKAEQAVEEQPELQVEDTQAAAQDNARDNTKEIESGDKPVGLSLVQSEPEVIESTPEEEKPSVESTQQEEISAVEKLKVMVRENKDAGVPSSFAIDESKPESPESSLNQEKQETESDNAEPAKIEARENRDAGVVSSFAIDQSEPESPMATHEDVTKDVTETTSVEAVKIEARENNDAGVAASFSIDESEHQSTVISIEEAKQAKDAEVSDPAKIEARENNDAGVPASFAIDELNPETSVEPVKEVKVEKETDDSGAEKIEARENNDAGVPASFAIDESTSESKQAAANNNEAGQSDSSELAMPKSSNPFMSRSVFSPAKEEEGKVTDAANTASELPPASEEQPVSVVVQAPNPFLANVKSYQEKLAKEKEKREATLAMDALNPGSAPLPAADGEATENKTAKQDNLSSFSTGSLSLEPLSGDQSSEDKAKVQQEKPANPESVIAEQPNVLSMLNSKKEEEKQQNSDQTSQQHFVSPGLPNSNPAEERGLRPEPPADLFKTSGSDLSLEQDNNESAPSQDSESAQPATGSHDKSADQAGKH